MSPSHLLILFLTCTWFIQAQHPEPVWGTLLGTQGADNVADAAFGDDGSIYVVGNLETPLTEMDGVALQTIGLPDPDAKYGCAYVMKLNPETGVPVNAIQFAPGLLHLTSIVRSDHGIYLAGYATRGMEPLAQTHEGLRRSSGNPENRFSGSTPIIHRHDPRINKARDGRGSPMILRIASDFKRIDAATFLEGWHHIWHVPYPLREDRYSPVALGILKDGDVVVSHDGGQLTHDPETAQANGFYQAYDHLSRLSPDLEKRRWHRRIMTPPVELSRARQLLRDTFEYTWMGNVRTFRLRVDSQDRIYVCGWSASQTMNEPWWSPFLIQFHPENGAPVWSGWTVDPTGGGDGRMQGLVSDSVVRSIAFDEHDRLLAALNSDGGNNIAARLPNDYTTDKPKLKGDSPWGMRGRTLFIGNVQRLDSTREQRLHGAYILGRHNRTCTAAWPIDLCALPGGHVFVVGRYTRGFPFKDAWSPSHSPGSFLRVYREDFSLTFSTGLDGMDLRTVTSSGRLLLVTGSTQGPLPFETSGLNTYQGGASDGVVMLIRIPES